MGYKPIISEWISPPRPQDERLVLDALDGMAEMEREVLGFLDPKYGLAYSYGGSNLPEKLPEDRYPCVLHLPRGSGRLQSLTTMGGSSLLGHPGGTRQHEYPFSIYWLVGHRATAVERLIVDSAFWCKAVDMAYCANPSLSGMVKEVGLSSFYWGEQSYAGITYYGWIFNGTVRMQYTFQGAG